MRARRLPIYGESTQALEFRRLWEDDGFGDWLFNGPRRKRHREIAKADDHYENDGLFQCEFEDLEQRLDEECAPSCASLATAWYVVYGWEGPELYQHGATWNDVEAYAYNYDYDAEHRQKIARVDLALRRWEAAQVYDPRWGTKPTPNAFSWYDIEERCCLERFVEAAQDAWLRTRGLTREHRCPGAATTVLRTSNTGLEEIRPWPELTGIYCYEAWPGIVKIGKAINIAQRLRKHSQSAVPRLLAFWGVSDAALAHHEAELVQRFREQSYNRRVGIQCGGPGRERFYLEGALLEHVKQRNHQLVYKSA